MMYLVGKKMKSGSDELLASVSESPMTEEPHGHFFLNLMMWPLLDHTQFSALWFRAASAVGVG